MLKKLAALSLSLVLCLSALPCQAGAMDAPENDPPAQTDQDSSGAYSENADDGIAPCQAVAQDILGNNTGGGGGGGENKHPVNDARWPGTGGYYLP